ncbi:hypothetical protein AB0K04_04465 [Micromonospora coxensis]|uniref:hypothetical protein n=1 Tax=Micromonospora coxensis TaxID=356852 RepID=UPI00341E6F86
MNRLPTTLLAGALALGAVVPTAAAPAAAAVEARPGTATASRYVDVTAARPGAAGGELRAALVTAGRTASPQGPAARTVTDSEVLSVRGAGPFRIGARLSRLSAAGLIDWTVVGCDGVVHAGVTGEWAGVVLLAFRHGRLVEVGTATVPPRSPAGAGVGMFFAELEAIYGRRGSMIRNDAGTASAYLVRFGTRVELFTGHPIRSGVGYFQVGPADFVERRFRQGRSC